MRKLTTEEFIRRAKEVHGDRYDYSKVEYKTSQTKVTIVCEEHGEFLCTPANHLYTTGCKGCRYKLVSESLKSNQLKHINNNLGGIIDEGSYLMIPYKANEYFKIDKEDYPKIQQYNWRKIGNYIGTSYQKQNKSITILLHRLIMNAPDTLQVDHLSKDEMDNRKNNLRVCTQQQNIQGARPRKHSSKYKGVSLCSKSGRWRSHITTNGKFKQLGKFDDEIEAAQVYDRKAKELFGEFAYLNFKDEN